MERESQEQEAEPVDDRRLSQGVWFSLSPDLGLAWVPPSSESGEVKSRCVSCVDHDPTEAENAPFGLGGGALDVSTGY